jgi:molecular chaperone Hsp33
MIGQRGRDKLMQNDGQKPRQDMKQRVRSEFPDDELVRTLSLDGGISLRAVVARNVVAEAATRRPVAPTALNAVGRCLVGAVLLATGNKHGEVVQIQLRGDGPLGTLTAICDSDGRVRGTVKNPSVDLPLAAGHPDVARAIGLGVLSVVRSHPTWREPYIGTVPLISGEVAGDLTLYLTESEQTPSAVGLGVALGSDGVVAEAGGFLVQPLPDADEDVIARLEQNVLGLPPVSELLASGVRADGLIDLLSEGFGTGERHRARPEFYCPCTRERALRTLALLGARELQEIVDDGAPQEVCCEFCGRRYDLTVEEIAPLVADAPSV